MITLRKKEIKIENSASSFEIEAELARLKVLAEKQRDRGYGYPKEVINRIAEKLYLPILLNEFQAIETPLFARFTYYTSGSAQFENEPYKSFDTLPEYLMVLLNSSIEKIQCQLKGNGQAVAALPFIPEAIQERMDNVKELIPQARFWMILKPQWEKKPQEDPYIIAECANEWVEVGSWGSDSDCLSEFILNRFN